jgi:hypothetical protein
MNCDFVKAGDAITCSRCGLRAPSTKAIARCDPERIQRQSRATSNSGPGTELKKLLAKIGITATPNCSCNAKAQIMDANGVEWCEQHIDEIVGWLREEATKRKLPFVDMAGRLLVKRAIANARQIG